MSPIENIVPNLVHDSTKAANAELRNKQDRSRDLYGVQLEVSCRQNLLIFFFIFVKWISQAEIDIKITLLKY